MADVTISTSNFSSHGAVDTDNVIVPESNGANIDAGLDNGGIDLGRLIVGPLYRFMLGSEAAPLQINASLVKYYGLGGFHYAADDNAGAAELTDKVIIQAGNPNVYCTLNTQVGSTSGKFSEIVCLRGNIVMKSAIDFTATTGIVQVGYTTGPGDVRLSIAATANTLPILTCNSGRTTCNAAVTTANVYGGRLIQDLAAITTLNIGAGGHVQYDHTAGTTINIYSGGTLDLTRTLKFKTITTINVFAGGTLSYDADQHSGTVNHYDTVPAAAA